MKFEGRGLDGEMDRKEHNENSFLGTHLSTQQPCEIVIINVRISKTGKRKTY